MIWLKMKQIPFMQLLMKQENLNWMMKNLFFTA